MAKANWISGCQFAHRGLHSSEYPENSMPAFEAASTAGYGIELDVHISADDQLIVFHDHSVKRMTGQEGLIAELDTATLQTYRLKGSNYSIPTLEQVFEVVNRRVPVIVEIKAGNPMARLGPELIRLLASYRGQVAIQSFDPRIVLWLRKNIPEIPRGQLSGLLDSEYLSPITKLLLRLMVFNVITRPDFVAYDVKAMPSFAVSLWRKILRIPILLWTIRDQLQADLAASHQANIIFEGFIPNK